MTKPCPIPRDLKFSDIAICNHEERLKVEGYYDDGDLRTSAASDGRFAWRPDGRNYGAPGARWIIRIERIASAPAKAKKAKVDTVYGWFFSCTHMGKRSTVVYCGNSRDVSRQWARNLRGQGERTGPIVQITVPAPRAIARRLNNGVKP